MGLRKINSIGIKQANKVMQMAAIAYNLKKYLKFIQKAANTSKQRLSFCLKQIKEAVVDQISFFKPFEKLQIFI